MQRRAAITTTVPFTDPAAFIANGVGAGLRRETTPKGAVPFVLSGPVRVSADGAQELRLAAPVTAFFALNLSLQVFVVEFPTTITIFVETGMQNESDDGWQTVDSFSTVVTSPTTTTKLFRGLLRYVRYRVSLNGSTAITFAIQGVAYGAVAGAKSPTVCAGGCGSGGGTNVSGGSRPEEPNGGHVGRGSFGIDKNGNWRWFGGCREAGDAADMYCPVSDACNPNTDGPGTCITLGHICQAAQAARCDTVRR